MEIPNQKKLFEINYLENNNEMLKCKNDANLCQSNEGCRKESKLIDKPS